MNLERLARAADDGATLLIRTDFTDDAAWQQVAAEIARPVDFDDEPWDPDDDEDDELDDHAFAPDEVAARVEAHPRDEVRGTRDPDAEDLAGDRDAGDLDVRGPGEPADYATELVELLAEGPPYADEEDDGFDEDEDDDDLPDEDDEDDQDAGYDDGYEPSLEVVDDRDFDGISGEELGRLFEAAGLRPGYAILVDARAIDEAHLGGEGTVVYVDLTGTEAPDRDQPWASPMGNTFRTVVREVASIEANLLVANVDFRDFADATDEDGVLRDHGDQPAAPGHA